jgi:predicted transcriptional regulator
MVNAAQIRAARSWLQMDQEMLAEISGVSARSIARFENGETVPQDRTLRDLRRAIEDKGIEFLFDGHVGVGIRVKPK